MYGLMIQQLRKGRKMSQKELGDHLGIGVSTISMWESEKREPDLTHLMAIAELFDVSADYILHGKNKEYTLSSEEAYALMLFRRLSREQQFEVKGFMKGILLGDGDSE